jgi:twitching motility protein PilI
MAEASSDGDRLYGLIAGLDVRYRALGTRLPDDTPPIPVWAGVLFRIREQSLLAPLEQIAEVLELPADITAVGGTKPWVLGVANNRGTLLPIFDLAALALGVVSARRESDRVLVVRQDELPCGLVVSETIGIRHFETTRRVDEPSVGLGVLEPFVDSAFPLAGEDIPVLALDRLIADPLLGHGAV